MNGNFGRFGGILYISELLEPAVYAENRPIGNWCQNKMTAVFQLYSKTKLIESFIKLVLDRNFVHCSPISL